jgi:hypothetical protein
MSLRNNGSGNRSRNEHRNNGNGNGNNEIGNEHRNNGKGNGNGNNGSGSGNNGKVQTTGTIFKKIVFTKETDIDSIINKLQNEIKNIQKNFIGRPNKNHSDNYFYADKIRSTCNKYLSLTPCRERKFGTNYYLWKGNLNSNNEKNCENNKVKYYEKIKTEKIFDVYNLCPNSVLSAQTNIVDPAYQMGYYFGGSVVKKNNISMQLKNKLDEKIKSHKDLINKYKMIKSSTAGGQKTVKKPVKKPTTKKTTTKKPTTKKPVKKPTTKKPVKKTTTKK